MEIYQKLSYIYCGKLITTAFYSTKVNCNVWLKDKEYLFVDLKCVNYCQCKFNKEE